MNAREQRKRIEELRNRKDPPEGFTSWVDYATTHQHVGSGSCWQCVAREKALAEYEELRKK